MLPLVFHPLHELFEPLLAAELNQEKIVIIKEGISAQKTFPPDGTIPFPCRRAHCHPNL